MLTASNLNLVLLMNLTNKRFTSTSPPSPLGSTCRKSTLLLMLLKESQGYLHPGKILWITSPSPILHPLDANTTHFISPVHKDWPLEIRNLDSLHYLAIQWLVEGSCHLHCVADILSTLMVVERVQPKDRIVLVFGNFLFKMLFSSRVSISSRFSKICCDLLSTLQNKCWKKKLFLITVCWF